MSIQTFFSYANSLISYLNEKLAGPSKYILEKLSINPETLPEILNTPVAIFGILIFILFSVLSFASNLLCNLVAILYPLYYNFVFLTKERDESEQFQETSLTFNKYWVIYGLVNVLEIFFSFVLYLVPFYFHLKLLFIYFLV